MYIIRVLPSERGNRFEVEKSIEDITRKFKVLTVCIYDGPLRRGSRRTTDRTMERTSV